MSTPQVVLSYDFSDLAEEYRQAYYALPERTPISWPRYFLFCHSIELLLKAYLARIGLTENQLQAFGHNIKNLLDEANKLGLPLRPKAQAKIEQPPDPPTNPWPRYPMTTPAPIALIYQFEPDATELFEAVNAALRGGQPFLDGQG